jgi:hypothetical protein
MACVEEKPSPDTSQDLILQEEPVYPMKGLTVIGRMLSASGALIRPSFDEETGERMDAGGVVFVVKGPGEFQFPPPPQQPLQMWFDQGKILPPYGICTVGQEVIVTPKDGKAHNLTCGGTGYSDPSPVVQPPLDGTSRRVFGQPCNFMNLSDSAQPTQAVTLTVTPSSLFACPNREGMWSLSYPFPPGDYTLRAVAPGYGTVEKQVTLSAAVTVLEVDFQFRF